MKEGEERRGRKVKDANDAVVKWRRAVKKDERGSKSQVQVQVVERVDETRRWMNG